MKRVVYKNKQGVLRVALLRDNDDPNFPEIGIQLEPPPIRQAIMDAIPEVESFLIGAGIDNYQDIVNHDGIISTAVQIIRKSIVQAYKLKELEEHGKQL